MQLSVLRTSRFFSLMVSLLSFVALGYLPACEVKVTKVVDPSPTGGLQDPPAKRPPVELLGRNALMFSLAEQPLERGAVLSWAKVLSSLKTSAQTKTVRIKNSGTRISHLSATISGTGQADWKLQLSKVSIAPDEVAELLISIPRTTEGVVQSTLSILSQANEGATDTPKVSYDFSLQAEVVSDVSFEVLGGTGHNSIFSSKTLAPGGLAREVTLAAQNLGSVGTGHELSTALEIVNGGTELTVQIVSLPAHFKLYQGVDEVPQIPGSLSVVSNHGTPLSLRYVAPDAGSVSETLKVLFVNKNYPDQKISLSVPVVLQVVDSFKFTLTHDSETLTDQSSITWPIGEESDVSLPVTRSFLIANTGIDAITVSPLFIGEQWQLSNSGFLSQNPLVLAAGQTGTISVSVDSTQAGQRATLLQLTLLGSVEVLPQQASVINLNLSRRVNPRLKFVLSQNTQALYSSDSTGDPLPTETVLVKQYRDAFRDLVLENTGKGDLNVVSIGMPTWLSVDSGAFVLARGASRTLKLRYKNEVAGDFNGTLRFDILNPANPVQRSIFSLAVKQTVSVEPFALRVTYAGQDFNDSGAITWPTMMETPGYGNIYSRVVVVENLSTKDMNFTMSWIGNAWTQVISGFQGWSSPWVLPAGGRATLELQMSTRVGGLRDSIWKMKFAYTDDATQFREIPIHLVADVISKVGLMGVDSFNRAVSTGMPLIFRGAAKDVSLTVPFTIRNWTIAKANLSDFKIDNPKFTVVSAPSVIEASKDATVMLRFNSSIEELAAAELSFRYENVRASSDFGILKFPLVASTFSNITIPVVIKDEQGAEISPSSEQDLGTLIQGAADVKRIFTLTNTGTEALTFNMSLLAEADPLLAGTPAFNAVQILQKSEDPVVTTGRPRVVPPAGSTSSVGLAAGASKKYSVNLRGDVVGHSKLSLTLVFESTLSYASKTYNQIFHGKTFAASSLTITTNFATTKFLDNDTLQIEGRCEPGFLVSDATYGGTSSTTCSAQGAYSLIVKISNPASDMPSVSINQRSTAASPVYSSVGKSFDRFAQGIPNDRPLAERVIVLYNLNVSGSLEVANYYAQKRGINAARVCGVELPPGLYASPEEMSGAFAKIHTACLCPLIDASRRPSPCGPDQMNVIETEGIADHFVFIRGIPARIVMESITKEDPAMGWYFRDNLFKRPNGALGRTSIYYGHVEALTPVRTKALIDRTLEAERIGFEGLMLSADSIANNSQYMDIFNGIESPDCMATYNSPVAAWDLAKCQFGAQVEGSIPAGSMHPSGKVAGVGFYAGPNPWPNGQQAFNGSWANLLSWRKGPGECFATCKEFSTVAEQNACREKSLDYFKVLNTDCVGGSTSLMGFQLRSWPVSFYGFMPNGWMNFWSGDADVTAMNVFKDDAEAYKDARFQDASFARIGDRWANINAKCGEADCAQRIPLTVSRTFALSQNLSKDVRNVHAKFKIRFKTARNTGKYLKIYVKLGDSAGMMTNQLLNLDLGTGNAVTWSTAELPIDIADADLVRQYNRLEVYIYSIFADDIRGFIELDGLELLDLANGESILPVEAASFAEDQETVAILDSGATMIDRLGAVAWWGSSSHYMTGGWAFGSVNITTQNFFRGQGLGRSVIRSGGLQTGLLFGDPLYNPAAAALDLVVDNTPVQVTSATISPYATAPRDLNANVASIAGRYAFTSASSDFVNLRAYNGSNNDSTLQWKIEKCSQIEDPSECSRRAAWTVVKSGTGAVRSDTKIFASLMELVRDPAQAEIINVRLQVSKTTASKGVIQSQLMLKYNK